jgi:aminodeoxyfutalosine synthase
MMTISTFDDRMARIDSGGRLTPDEIQELSAAPDVLPLGMLADALRRRLHGTVVTFVRVADWGADRSPGEPVPAAAREVRITGVPESLEAAVGLVAAARVAADDRVLAAFSWHDVERLAGVSVSRRHGDAVAQVLQALRDAGLDALAELPLDALTDADAAVERLRGAGFQQLRFTVDAAGVGERAALWVRAAELQDRFACIQSLGPLPVSARASRPSTGYQDVKMVALARLAAPNIPTIQVSWSRHGPKLAQVALTFGADDVYGISASDDAAEGRRRAPLEEIRRNIEAAGFEPMERDGRFTPAP